MVHGSWRDFIALWQSFRYRLGWGVPTMIAGISKQTCSSVALHQLFFFKKKLYLATVVRYFETACTSIFGRQNH